MTCAREAALEGARTGLVRMPNPVGEERGTSQEVHPFMPGLSAFGALCELFLVLAACESQ